MTSTCRYRQVMYWAQKLLLKYSLIRDNAPGLLPNHHQIQDRTHAVLLKHCQIQYRVQRALSKKDCERVHLSDNFVSRYAPLNFIKMRRFDETCCIIVWCSIREKSTILSPWCSCTKAINQILTTRQKEHYIRCEVRLFLRTGQQHCLRSVKNGIREVACA